MENQLMKIRVAIFSLMAPVVFTACEVSDWLPQMMDITKDIMTTFIEAKTTRSDETIEMIHVDAPAFISGRADASEEQHKFFSKVKSVQYITPVKINEPLRQEIRAKVNEHAGTKNVNKLYASVNNYVIGLADAGEVHDVMVIKDDGVQLQVFGLKGIFARSAIESLSASGEIFETMNYLKR